MRLGILGGSFDPPHNGHLAMARTALGWGLERIILIPALIPPHKQHRALSKPYQRYAMAELAALTEAQVTVDPIELERAGPSYTIDTVREYRRLHEPEELFVMVGEDNWRTLSTWKDLAEFPQYARFMVFERTGLTPGPSPVLEDSQGRGESEGTLATELMPLMGREGSSIRPPFPQGESSSRGKGLGDGAIETIPDSILRAAVHFPGFDLPFSSSGIRDLIAAADPTWESQVPAHVRTYIAKHDLYRDRDA